MKEVWIEQTVGGLKLLTKRTVRSRRKQPVDIGAYLDRAVAVGMYGWAAILSVFAIMAFIRCI